MEPTYEELKARTAKLEAELAKPAPPRREISARRPASPRSSTTAARPTPRATKIRRAWYLALAYVAFVIVSATATWGIEGFFGSIVLGCIMLLTFWDKDIHFIR